MAGKKVKSTRGRKALTPEEKAARRQARLDQLITVKFNDVALRREYERILAEEYGTKPYHHVETLVDAWVKKETDKAGKALKEDKE